MRDRDSLFAYAKKRLPPLLKKNHINCMHGIPLDMKELFPTGLPTGIKDNSEL